MALRVFVDGAAGTVGSALHLHLAYMVAEGVIEQLVLPEAHRKDAEWRKAVMREADIVVVCLPDDEAGAAVALVESVNPGARILDASATHRCHPEWVYGLPELGFAEAIGQSARVANPGCFASACILGGKPLVEAFALPLMAFQGVTGYSAAGKKGTPEGAPMLVQFGKAHRHLPEIARYTGAQAVLTTMVGPWKRGMLVQAYVPVDADRVYDVLAQAYAGTQVSVAMADATHGRVDPQGCNGSNAVAISVAGQPGGGASVAVVLDNLGKGSAGAAADNLKRMISS